MLKLEKIKKVFNQGTPDETTLFNSYDLNVNKGDFVSIVGSNGSGKTTLLNMICGTEPIDGGKIIFDGADITTTPEFKRAAYIGRVLQDPRAGTCSGLTVLENMSLADNKNKRYNLTKAINKQRADYYRTLLEKCGMGLENKMNIKVNSLSGGQRQALALVIANMADIKLLILDEHTAALDPHSSETIMELTQKIISENNVTSVMVTHNLRYAVEYGNRLLMMHEGKNVLNIGGAKKENTKVDDLLEIFNDISIEMGN